MSKFQLLGKEYTGAKIGFNEFCNIESNGGNLLDVNNHILGTVRAYVAVSLGVDSETAGNMIEEHMVNGGTLDSVLGALGEQINESGFLKAQTQKK